MKNLENSVINKIGKKSEKMEKLNKIAENAEHLGLDYAEKEKLIDSVDKLGLELDSLEKISGLTHEEIESIYTNISKEDVILETKRFFSKLTQKQQKKIIKGDRQTFFKTAQKHITPRQLVIVAVGFLAIISNAYEVKGINLEHIGKGRDVVNEQIENIETDMVKIEQSGNGIEQFKTSPEQKKQIDEVIIPKILDKFRGFTYAEFAIMSQRNMDYSQVEDDPRLIMLFFDEPKESEMLDEYLIRQAKRGVLNSKDVDILYKYFSHREYKLN